MKLFFKGKGKASHPTRWAAIYVGTLLLLFILGVIENQFDSEGMGFFPLLVLSTPWSWLMTGLWDSPIWGSSLSGRHLAIFATCNVLSGAVNGYILYFLLNRWQKNVSGASVDPDANRDAPP